MNKTSRVSRYAIGSLLAVAATAAQAHPGHGGLISGFAHPLSGIDHMAAMVAVGLWAARLKGRARWALPSVFLMSIVLGALLPASSTVLGVAEQGIVISLLVLGGGLVAALRMPVHVASVLMGLAGVCHGYAHGVEIPMGDSVNQFMAGMVVSTLTLHALGVFLGARAAARSPLLVRFWGVPVVAVAVASVFAG